jgi:hypothetical protein
VGGSLAAAGHELHAAGELGAVTIDTAELTAIQSGRCWELVQLMADDRQLAGTEHRVRDGL